MAKKAAVTAVPDMSTFRWEGADGVPTDEADWEALDSIPLSATGLPRQRALRSYQVYTLGQLLLWPSEEVARFDKIGREAMRAYHHQLAQWGLRFPTAKELEETEGSFWVELRECELGQRFRTPRHLVGALPLWRHHDRQSLYSLASRVQGLFVTCELQQVSQLVLAIRLGHTDALARQADKELGIEAIYHHYALDMGSSPTGVGGARQTLVHMYLRDLSIFAEAVNLHTIYPEL